MDRKNVWTTYTEEELKELDQINTLTRYVSTKARRKESALRRQLPWQKRRVIEI